MRRGPRAALAAYLLLCTVHLLARLLDADLVAGSTQVLLMPALAAYLLVATAPGPRPRLVHGVLTALGFSWLGDTAPRLLDGDAAFLAMIACFLCAQITYITAFWPLRRGSLLHQHRPWAALYGLAFLALVAVCAPGAGAMLPAVLLYGACLTATALLTTGVHRLAAVGGALFFISDGLIALDAFATGLPMLQSFAVMATYAAAQLLIVLGVLRRPGCERPDDLR